MSYAASQSNAAWQSASLPSFLQDLVTFRGRMNRARYWGAILTVMCLSLVAVMIVAAMRTAVQGPVAWAALATVAGAMFIAMAVPCYFIAIKRLHDRDKSGHWLWLFCLAPAALNLLGKLLVAQGAPLFAIAIMLAGIGISVWGVVEIGFLRGTAGPNRFGPDPLATQGA
jgi:uncharacterized membrane protein YhaH (DUF805 family)